jgi:hypothetical protein
MLLTLATSNPRARHAQRSAKLSFASFSLSLQRK